MRKLLNTIFITQPEVYLSLDGENIVLLNEKEKVGRLPLHNIEGIVSFGYRGISPALMGYCAENHISIVFLTKSGRFLARVSGKSRGNVTLRKNSIKSQNVKILQLKLQGILYLARYIIINGCLSE